MNCENCKGQLSPDFLFCPYCGVDLKATLVCPQCKHENEQGSKFCSDCGQQLATRVPAKELTPQKRTVVSESPSEVEPPPKEGITVEFPYSSAQSFNDAVAAAKTFPSFKQYGCDKNAVYRAVVQSAEMNFLMPLIEQLKGWRRRTVYVDGEKTNWDAVFAFTWCYERKKASFKPEYYCFGFENSYQLNIWGCIQAQQLSFIENAEWFTWGRWVNERGDWEFDKERIKFELQKSLFHFRFCPAMNPGFVENALSAFPNVVNPTKDQDWKFVESWGDSVTNGLKIKTKRLGYEQEVVVKGVCPNGQGALRELAKKLKFRLPE